jgi:hypothetical protein
MTPEQIILRKISVTDLINALIHLHSLGVVYVNISGKMDDNKDIINFTFSSEYLEEDSPLKDELENSKEERTINPLLDNDLNELI